MRTLSVTISEKDYNSFGIHGENISFKEILDLIYRQQFKEHLNKSIVLAGKNALQELSKDEINDEIKAVRNDKSSH